MVIERLYNEQIANAPITEFALGYDEVKHHSWYDNLDYLIELSKQLFSNDSFIMDYSCGTGIVCERMDNVGLTPSVLMADASLKYLRLAYEKFKDIPSYSFRLLDLKKSISESIIDDIDGKLDGIICSNAIHLYPSIDDTISEWGKLLKKGGKVLINSGNINNPKMKLPTSVLIDQTVNEIFSLSFDIVKNNKQYHQYLNKISDTSYIEKYVELKNKYFLPIRNIEYYTDSLYKNGFIINQIKTIDVRASVKDWFDFLKVYDDGILGWIGGVEKISGNIANLTDIQNRLDIMEEAIDIIFNKDTHFNANWNYIICEKI